MERLGPSPFAWLEFDKDGKIVDNAIATINAMINEPDISDLVFISHGWKNDKKDATNLYGTLWTNACLAMTATDATKIVVIGVLWPAKKYETDFDEEALADSSAGPALGAGGGAAIGDLPSKKFTASLKEFKAFLGPSAEAVIEAAKSAAGGLDQSKARKLVKSGAKAVGLSGATDPELRRDAAPILNAADPQLLLNSLADPPRLKLNNSVGSAQGLGSALKGLVSGPRAAVARFLNQLTYYEMKKRAGIVGASLGKNVIGKLKPTHPVRLHLIGHSFGARLVAAAASALPDNHKFEFFSLTLLQGAFSHNALAKEVKPGLPGAFANVVGRPKGPIAITHTHNDKACTLAYAIASRLSRDVAKAIGDKNDEFGAMGANGAQKLPATASAPQHKTGPFKPKGGKINGFLADAYIIKTATSDAHNNVTNKKCGELVAAVIES